MTISKKIEDIKEDKQLKALSNKEIQNNIMNQFQLDKKKKIMDKKR